MGITIIAIANEDRRVSGKLLITGLLSGRKQRKHVARRPQASMRSSLAVEPPRIAMGSASLKLGIGLIRPGAAFFNENE
jgi:hypothetical protein